jgi:hypothetical protein
MGSFFLKIRLSKKAHILCFVIFNASKGITKNRLISKNFQKSEKKI